MTIEQRLSKLERENRRLKTAGLVVAIVAAVAIGMGAQRQGSKVLEDVQARQFTLVGADGKSVGFIKSETGRASLTLYAGDRYTTVAASTDSTSGLSISDGEVFRVRVGVNGRGEAGLAVYDESQEPQWSAP